MASSSKARAMKRTRGFKQTTRGGRRALAAVRQTSMEATTDTLISDSVHVFGESQYNPWGNSYWPTPVKAAVTSEDSYGPCQI